MKKTFAGLLLLFTFSSSYSQTFSLFSTHFTKGDVFRTWSIQFDLGSENIRPDCFPFLDSVASFLNKYPFLIIEIGEHTSTRGADDANLKLSQKRAERIR